MPPLGTAQYIQRLAAGIDAERPGLFGECLSALARLGIRTDYDLLLQPDVLEQAPAAVHRPIRALRMAVLDRFACAGATAADLLQQQQPGGDRAPAASGIRPLDALLDGGAWAGGIVEVCGDDAAVNTRVAVEFAVGHLARGGDRVDGRAFLLQSSPPAVWLIEAAVRRRLGAQAQLAAQAMERISVVDCSDLDALLAFLFHYADTDPGATADLLVIDSIRPLVIGAMQQHDGGHVAVHAVKTALRAVTAPRRPLPAAVLITNGVSRRPAPGDAPPGRPAVQPSLGAAWALVSHVHVHLSADVPDGGYTATIIKSPSTHVGRQCRFAL
ncbi:DNA repair protein rad51d [Coemansia javaensis]|uniref:DNA repair protein rad51d n=1 Tax=Coemansia javaensis TaxID=2761396 RepID=A0A9W8LIH6_9FUNG|nr:DNA repair protein rad51d [Coemansia javaensis]